MFEKKLLINKQLPPEKMAKISASVGDDSAILFVVLSEITKAKKYARVALVGTADFCFTYNIEKEEIEEKLYYKDAKSFYVKRLYGNGVLRAVLKDDSTLNLFRFTFTITGFCDAIAYFANAIISGEKVDTSIEILEESFEKQLSVCPKCGRTLSSSGVECITCSSKGKIFSLFAHYMKPHAPLLSLIMIITLVSTALNLLPTYLTQILIDSAIPNKDVSLLLWVTIALMGKHVVCCGLNIFASSSLRACGDKIVASLKKDVYEKAQMLPMRFYDKSSIGSIISRINEDTGSIQNFMLNISQNAIVQLFTLIAIITVMLVLNAKLTMFALVPIPFIVIFTRFFERKISKYYKRIRRRSSATSQVLTDTLPGIRVIKAFTNEKESTQKYSLAVNKWQDTDIAAGKIIHTFANVVGFFMAASTAFIWLYGSNLAMDAESGISVGLLVSFISYAGMFYGPVHYFANFTDSYQSAMSSIERILNIIDAEPEHDFGKGNVLPEVKGRLEFKNVNFSFDRAKKVLKNINFVIEPGDIVGVVGTTGAGKSTLINLMLRYYDHYDGTILLDGHDIRKIDMEFYRSKIGFVQQEPMMFHDSIFNNIAYGGDYSVEDVIRAADTANAHEFIVRQPDGYDSILGERGVGLSGGERQRISISRAVLKNPSILIFDEATASVDSETEHLIQEAIEHLISGRTTIMIAHRLSTLNKANKIIVVDEGEIIEFGSPEELLAAKGKYYKLVQIQSMSDKVQKAKQEERFE